LKNIVRFVLLLAVIGLGCWLWLTFFPSPEKIIAGRFAKLARAASVEPGEGAVRRMLDAQSVAGFFTTNVEINIDVPGNRQQRSLGRDEIAQALLSLRLPRGLIVKFPDVYVTVGADQETAQADVTVDARAPGEQDLLVQELKVTLRKIDGKWLITKVQTVRTFS
jgi:hypothetical protein